MGDPDLIRLLDVEPDLGRFLNDADEQVVGDLLVPVVPPPPSARLGVMLRSISL